MPEQIRISIIDDHPLFRDGVVQALDKTHEFNVVAVGNSAEDAIRIAADERPDVILLDLSMPGGGLRAAQSISTSHPHIKTLMLTVSEDGKDVFASMEAGVSGYICKGVGSSELISFIKAASRGEFVITPSLAGRLLIQVRNSKSAVSMPKHTVAKLTDREEEVVEFVARGKTNKEIAKLLQLSEKTVKHYMTTIMRKLHVRNRVEAAINIRQMDYSQLSVQS
jgi:two-component system, NarL family, nitrate/nitrite response regulator NarL